MINTVCELSLTLSLSFSLSLSSLSTGSQEASGSVGSLLSSSKEWFHGELPQAEAEQALMTSECDCFLIRQEHQSLILSLRHQNSVHHVNIQFGPGWYKLENGSAQDSFAELDHLLAYYRENALSKTLDAKLGPMCEKKSPKLSGQPVAYGNIITDTSTSTSTGVIAKPAIPSSVNSSYSSGNESLSEFSWYRGAITEEEANAALGVKGGNVFMVREGPTGLVLSRRGSRRKSHTAIQHDFAMGYRLKNTMKWFRSVPELILHTCRTGALPDPGNELSQVCTY